jgi:GPH family glycoside/pentoside/hexuronide:cation symporter
VTGAQGAALAARPGEPATTGAGPSRPPPLDLKTRVAYGFGAVAFGVKDNGFSYFLLLYYNQVLGLPAGWIGAVLMVSLLVDAVADPLIGHASDNLRSAWGRRHPFMYVAAAPVAIAYALLWRPPDGLSQVALLAYLLIVATSVRLAISFYEVPSSALAVELSQDYDQRTTLFAHRTFFAWCGGLGAGFLAYALFLLPDATHPVGQLNPGGYGRMGLGAGGLMVVAILASAIGTHGRIPYLRQAAERAPPSLVEVLREVVATLRNQSLLTLLGAGVFNSLAIGMGAALSIYVLSYFWGLSTGEVTVLALGMFLGALGALLLLPRLAARTSKRAGAMLAVAGYALVSLTPVAMNLAGVFPDHVSPWFLPLLAAANAGSTALMVCSITLMSSMLSDVVEESEVETGRKSEGVIFSANLFVQKCVSGLGVLGAGLLLTAVSFPQGASPGGVAPSVLNNLAIAFIATQAGFYLLAITLIGRFRITRAKHAEYLAILAARAATEVRD